VPREWYGQAPFSHPSPSSPSILRTFFPFLSANYLPHITPNIRGESITHLHDRIASALESIIKDVDAEIAAQQSQGRSEGDKEEYALLICSHAAPIIAMGRVLTGFMPDDISAEDFKPFTCGLSKFVRRRQNTTIPSSVSSLDPETDKATPDWREGNGVGGGWDCVVNGDCSFLSGGEERGWHFSGEEDFDTGPVDGKGLLGERGLGVNGGGNGPSDGGSKL
jgi:transcription factor C subunit 7